MNDYVRIAEGYALDVLAGRVPACKWVKCACRRQLDDIERARTDPEWPYTFSAPAAERICRFIEMLPHVKGKWSGELIELEPWQVFSLVCVFGWVRKLDGTRRFRSVYEEVPRKNAKTTKLAGIGLYGLVADGEFGAEVYSAATTRDQARIVFEISQLMARSDGTFRARFGLEVLTHSIAVRDTASKFVPLSAEGSSLDGLNVSMALTDELHAHKTRHVHDVLDSGMGARAQPLHWKITTAGSNREGVCYEQRSYLIKILNAVAARHDGLGYPVKGERHEDDTYWGIIYTIDDTDDWTDPVVWRKANPNYGVSVDPADMERMGTQAMAQASAQVEFKTKRLNVWVNADAPWMNMLAWDACEDPALSVDQFRGEETVLGLDLASKIDLAAKVKVFWRDAHLYAFARFWLPHATVHAPGNEHYAAWVAEGWITETPGNVIDFAVIEDECLADASLHQVAEIAYDPWQALKTAQDLGAEGFTMVEVRPTVQNFSFAMKELEALVLDGRFHHDGNPVLAWMAANVVCHRDAKDNIYPNKEKPEKKIDGIVALLTALNRALAHRPETGVGVMVL